MEYLERQGEISLRSIADDSFKKHLLLATASFFEQLVTDLILKFVSEQSESNDILVSIIKAKAIDRQYYSYFDWDKKNANRFFSLFGTRFSDSAKDEVSKNDDLDKAVRAFLELGQRRNELVHLNAATYFLEKTAEEIYQSYKEAVPFTEFISAHLASSSPRKPKTDPKA